MSPTTYFKKRAVNHQKTIVLPEGEDKRILEASVKITNKKIAQIIILGNKEKILNKANRHNFNLENVEIIDPANSNLLTELGAEFHELRKHKNISESKAEKIIQDPVYFGTMLVHTGKAAGLVAGAVNITANVLRPAFQIIKTKPGISTASGAFIMQIPHMDAGENDLFVFADCAVNPEPDSNQLAEIALSTAETAQNLLKMEPVVALLSFSTKGSVSHKLVNKVKKAVELAQRNNPDIEIDGELQADAALIKTVATTKAPKSKVAGRANVLIFPDLQSGNIGYKLLERLGGARALGPILQGLNRPINDLSRGCSVDDIINVVAITVIQAQNQ